MIVLPSGSITGAKIAAVPRRAGPLVVLGDLQTARRGDLPFREAGHGEPVGGTTEESLVPAQCGLQSVTVTTARTLVTAMMNTSQTRTDFFRTVR